MIHVDTGNIGGLWNPVISMMLSGHCDLFSALRQQLSSAKVSQITEDGYGVFVDFEISPETRIVTPEIEYVRVDGLVGVDDSLDVVCGFALFVIDGVMSQLDGYPFASDTWPRHEVALKFTSRDETGREIYTDKRSSTSLERYLFKEPIRTMGESRKPVEEPRGRFS